MWLGISGTAGCWLMLVDAGWWWLMMVDDGWCFWLASYVFFFRIGVTLFQSWFHELGIGQHSVEVIMSQLGGLRSKPLGAAWHEGKRTKRKVALIYTACHSWTVSLIYHLSCNFKVLSQSEMFKSRVSRDNKKARFEALLSRGVEAALESDSCHTLKVGASGHWLMIIQGIANSFGSFNDDAWTCLNINSSCSTQCPSIFKSCYSIWVLFVKHGFSGSRSWSIGSKSDRSGMSHSWMSLDRTWLYNQNWLVFDIYLFMFYSLSNLMGWYPDWQVFIRALEPPRSKHLPEVSVHFHVLTTTLIGDPGSI